MRSAVVCGGIAVAVGLASRLFLSHAQTQPTLPKAESPQGVYVGLRNLALQMSRSKAGLPPASKPTEPWGVVVDWGVSQPTTTIVAFSDGHGGDSGEAERLFRGERERHSGTIPNTIGA